MPLSPPVQETETPEPPLRQTWRKYLLPDSGTESSANENSWERRSTSRDRAPVPAPIVSTEPPVDEDNNDDWLDRRQRFRRSRTNPDLTNSTDEKEEAPVTVTETRRRKYSRAESNSFDQSEPNQTPQVPTSEDSQQTQAPAVRPRSSRYRRKEARSQSSYLTTEPDENGNPGRIEMSYSNPDGSHRYVGF